MVPISSIYKFAEDHPELKLNVQGIIAALIVKKAIVDDEADPEAVEDVLGVDCCTLFFRELNGAGHNDLWVDSVMKGLNLSESEPATPWPDEESWSEDDQSPDDWDEEGY